jgi:hypothetical protein
MTFRRISTYLQSLTFYPIVTTIMSVVLNNNSRQCVTCNSDGAVRSQLCDHYLCHDCGLQDSCQGCQAEKDYLLSRSEGMVVPPMSDDMVPAEAEPEPEECCICYDEIDGKKNKAVTKCGHLFCLTCLLTQFQNKNECPLCRRELLENSPNSFETIRIPISRTDNIFNRILSGDLNSSRGFFMTMVGHIWHDHCRTVVEALTRRYENLVIQLPGRALRDRPERPVGRRCGICRQEGHDRRRCPNRG